MRRAPWLPALALLAPLLAGCTGVLPPEDPPGPQGPPPADPDATVDLDRRFVHDHVAFALFLLGERVDFTHRDYDLSQRGDVSAHLHVNERNGGSIIHVEGNFPGGVPDVTLGRFLGIHGVDFRPGNLTLDRLDGHNGSSWPDRAGASWEVWVEPASGPWVEAEEGPALLLRAGQRVLVTYGASTEERAAQQELVPVPPGRPAEQPA